jgi:hypothetical protein
MKIQTIVEENSKKKKKKHKKKKKIKRMPKGESRGKTIQKI